MPDEALISEIENLLAEVVKLGGENERSSIVPNLTVQDANPTGLSNFIIVSDDKDGDNILASKVGSVVYSDNDLVNVMFIQGGEAIAFQQGSASSNSGIWEIIPSTTTDIFYDKGKVGIGTSTVPKAGVGSALFALEGPNYDDADGPHIQITTDEDDYPVMQHFFQGHDEFVIHFDAYTDSAGTDRSSAAFNNFQIQKSNGNFRIRYDSAVAAGGAISWLEGLTIDGTTGNVGIGTTSPTPKLESVSSTLAQLRLTHTFGSKFVDFTLDTNHDLTIKPSSTGQVIFQPTTDSVDFFQVLDANGGTPVLNVDSTNERVGIQNATPSSRLHITANSGSILTIDGSHTGTLCNVAPTNTGSGGSAQIWRQVPVFDPSAALTSAINFNTNVNVSNSTFDITNVIPVNSLVTVNGTYSGDITTVFNFLAQGVTDSGSGTITNYRAYAANDESAATNNYGFWSSFASGANKWALYMSGTADNYLEGDLGVGISVPLAKAHVDQASTTAAIPVLYLDQADVSEEMIQFQTTIGVGNAIEAVGAKTLTTTHFIKVTLPGGLTRYIPAGTIA
jgi:hypothetical protein